MHRVCQNCGTYRTRMVVDTLKKTLRAAKKAEGKNSTKGETTKVKTKELKTPKKESKAKTDETKRSKTEN